MDVSGVNGLSPDGKASAGLVRPRVSVICFGNALHGDDGFGVHVHRCLSERPIAKEVMLVDAGTRGLSALGAFDDVDVAVVVDAVVAFSAVGRVHRLRIEDIATQCAGFTNHATGAAAVLQALPLANAAMPKIVVIAAEVHRNVRTWCLELSDVVAQAVPVAVELIEAETRAELSRAVRISEAG